MDDDWNFINGKPIKNRTYRMAKGIWGLGFTRTEGVWVLWLGPWMLTTEPSDD